MRVLFVHETPGFQGGAERWVYQVAQGLGARHGFECHLASTQVSGRESTRFTSIFTTAHHVRCASDWERLTDDLQPDLLCVGNLASEDFQALARIPVPCVRMVHDHSLSCLSSKRLYTWTGKICNRTLGPGCWLCLGCVGRRQGRFEWNRLADKQRSLELTGKLAGTLVLSRYMRGELIQAGIEENRITVISPGLEVPERRHAVPERGNAVRLLFAGQVIRGKGLDLLIRAMAGLREDCELVVAGTGGALEKNQSLAAKLKIDKQVRFLGWQSPEEIEERYREADVVVVPSRWPEPFGLVGIEAMSHARPVVAFDVGGISDWLEHGKTGLLVSPASVDGLRAALSELIASPGLREQMGRAGREACLKKFRIEVMLDRLATCFERVVAENTDHRSQFCEPTVASATSCF